MQRAIAEYLSHVPVFFRRLEGEILHWTQGARDLYGYTSSEAVGASSHELLKTVLPEALELINAQLLETGEWRGRLRHTGRQGEIIWTESYWRLSAGAGGEPPRVVEINTSITERVEAERQREVLARELDHRVKNTLAIVQSLARMTFASADRRHVRRFDERLIALSHAHDLLLRQHWEQASLGEVIASVMRALGVEERVGRDGPDVQLSPNAAVSYALATHELCTNALKHGALSVAEGRVEVVWRVLGGDQRTLNVVWRESGGPPVTPPAQPGFGTRLIQRIVAGELSAPVDLRFEPSGLVCEFHARLRDLPEAPINLGE